jgi:hypothetical protein
MDDPFLFTTTASRLKRYPFGARGASFFLTSPFPHTGNLKFECTLTFEKQITEFGDSRPLAAGFSNDNKHIH